MPVMSIISNWRGANPRITKALIPRAIMSASILIVILAAFTLMVGAAILNPGDTASLIERLKSDELGEARKAREILLQFGPEILPKLRAAREAVADATSKTVLAGIVDRLEARSSALPMAAKWGERWYAMRNLGVKVGWMRLQTEAKDGQIVMRDEIYFNAKGQEGRYLHSMRSRPDEYLTPTSFSVDTQRPSKPWVIDGDVVAGKLIPRRLMGVRGESRIAALQPNFVTEFSVMRLAVMVAKPNGYDLSVLGIWEKPVILEAVLKYEGEEAVDLDSGPIKASRYVLTNPQSSDRFFWVDGEGRLVKARVYTRIEFVLTDESRAKELPAPQVEARAERPRKPTPAPKPAIEAKLPVFPGAEGFGTRTPAGRGGKIVEVTSLDDSGAGTLRAALAEPRPRLVIFRVGGTIVLKRPLVVQQPFLTLAGQTAPGEGILLRDFGLVVETHDVLVQHLRIRPGNQGAINPEDNDAIQVNGGYNVVVDHVSASWGEDETIQTWAGAHDVTLSWCLESEPLNKSRHPKGRHGAGVILGDGSDRITIHHCLLAHNDFRSPLIINSGAVDFIENLIFDWGRSAGEIYDNLGWAARVNVIGNRYVPGPSSLSGVPEFVINRNEQPAGALPKIYARDNWGPRRHSAGSDEFALFALGWGGQSLPPDCRAVNPLASRAISRLQRVDLTEAVLTGVGATQPRRDAVDHRIVGNFRHKRGALINSPEDVGGYPRITGGEAPRDSDGDGMPDDWEMRFGLDPRDSRDGNQDLDGDGYTNIEEYLFSLASGGTPSAKAPPSRH